MPHLTVRLASRFNWFRLFFSSRSESAVGGGGTGDFGVRTLGRDEAATVAKEKRWEVFGGGVRRWWRERVTQVRWWWWWNHGHCLRGRNTCWLMCDGVDDAVPPSVLCVASPTFHAFYLSLLINKLTFHSNITFFSPTFHAFYYFYYK